MRKLILALVFVTPSIVSFSQNSITSASNIDTTSIYDFYVSYTVNNANTAFNTNLLYILDSDSIVNLTFHNNSMSAIIDCKLFPQRQNSGGVTPYSLNALNTDTTFNINVKDFYYVYPSPTHDTIFTRVLTNYGSDMTWFKIVKVNQTQWDSIQNGEATAGINDLELTINRLSIYPNPASSKITVDFDATTNDVPVAIFSMCGQLVYSNDDYRNNGTNSLKVDITNFKDGIYYIKVGEQVKKLIVN